MTRQPSLRVVQRNEGLLQRVQALKAEHPFWGYRRIWASLRFVDQRPVNKKRIWRLMREHHLRVTPNPRLNAKRTPTRSTPQPTRSHEWWGIDLTKVLVQEVGWVSIVVVLDGYTTVIVGSYAGRRCTAQHWLSALEMARNQQFPQGVQGQALSLMSDNGCQPTSVAFMKACRTLGVSQAFTSDNNPKGNADTERLMRTLKEECLWLQEWTCPLESFEALTCWINQYNEQYWHSALGYKSPRPFEREYHSSHGTQLPAA
jgi:putative transposase